VARAPLSRGRRRRSYGGTLRCGSVRSSTLRAPAIPAARWLWTSASSPWVRRLSDECALPSSGRSDHPQRVRSIHHAGRSFSGSPVVCVVDFETSRRPSSEGKAGDLRPLSRLRELPASPRAACASGRHQGQAACGRRFAPLDPRPRRRRRTGMAAIGTIGANCGSARLPGRIKTTHIQSMRSVCKRSPPQAATLSETGGAGTRAGGGSPRRWAS
jgi:hypothetical protein